jgi:hypothetical protein
VLRYLSFILIGVCATARPVHAQYPYPPYGWAYRYDDTGSARIQGTPKQAEVYVDGYYVGTVDDFDGALQRLHVERGEHVLLIYLEGYRTIREKVLFTRGGTLKLSYAMQPLAAGEAQEPRPKPDEQPSRQTAGYGRGSTGQFGTLELRVRPVDATLLIDGEEWTLPEGQDRFFVDLSEGAHRVEVRKEGFVTYVRTVEVRRGRAVTLNVSLTAGRDSPSIATDRSSSGCYGR